MDLAEDHPLAQVYRCDGCLAEKTRYFDKPNAPDVVFKSEGGPSIDEH